MLWVFLLAQVCGEPQVGSKDKNYLELRALGFEAYAEDRWADTAKHFTEAIDNYWFRKKTQSLCINQCKPRVVYNDEIESITAYLKTSGCVEKCCRRALGDPILIKDLDVDAIFRKNQYYSLIQTAYTATHNYSGSLQSAVTHFLYNPTNVAMHQRIKDLYRILTIETGGMLPRREPEYNSEYRTGADYYNKQEWGPCVYHLERAVRDFLYTTDMCRVQCIYPYDKPASDIKVKSFLSAATQIVDYTGYCRANCYDDLPLQSASGSPYLASILEYLQYCQYKMGQYQDAADTTTSYILLDKRNEMINGNVDVYRDSFQLDGKVRKDIKGFIDNYERDTRLVAQSKDAGNNSSNKTYPHRTDKYFSEDGLLSYKECRSLVYLTEEIAIENDGYQMFKDKQTSPFTSYEKFSGITLQAAVEQADEGAIEIEHVQLYYDVVMAAKSRLESYFKLNRPLYFNYIHLVKRSSLNDKGRPVDDLSHPLHGDNCVLGEDKVCRKSPPAYTYRDWSSIVYLNKAKKGGDLIFTDKKSNVIDTVIPQCGRTVGFTGDTVHGVTALNQGARYTLGLWYTHDISQALDMEAIQRHIDSVTDRESGNDIKPK